ncbi:histidine kinase [Akanthomyces lecanii RCEF 1005]|uniref:Histidine kinase n=1 Tax=Akanthomyces lecanii RCEF 1005 TaxID=1081108 RepID=A0A167V058_CORDF|nr:histidine kinase [Akanthomyces lecanii RCEF 1005]
MSEILRAADLQADKAKADVLGSLSHELRSPLHGVILSAELLGESDLSVFQETAAHTIELCSRTLLDTIDHLLDYSKINSFARKGRQANGSAARSRRPFRAVAALDNPLQHGKKSLANVCQLDKLVEEVIESIFAGYTFQFMSAKRPQKPSMATAASGTARQRLVSVQNLTQLDPLLMEKAKLKQELALVSVILSIDPRQDWSCFVQVGAIRRIVMNIFGNALKYTKTGSIRVTLGYDVAVLNFREKQRVVKLTVEDTGKGISADFIQHGLFKPFSQEDPLSPGTGLGLSLVKRIVSEMRGEVSIQSQVGIGTTVVVTLPLEQVPADSGCGTIRTDINWKFAEQVTSLKGLRVGLALSQQPSGFNAVDWFESVRAVCKDWLMMDIVSSSRGNTLPDIILWSHDALPSSSQELKALARTPNVVLCSSVLVAHDHSASFDAANHVGVFEFVSQPIGPRKLAGALLLAYTRWMQLISSPTSKSTSQPGFRKADKITVAENDTSELGPSRPSIHRESSSFQSAASLTDDEAIFSDSNAQPAAVATMSGESPASELPNPFDKFLLVDDNHINIKVLAAYMKKLNIEYDTAVNGREAVELFCKTEKQYNCVLMDISMPIMNGFEATRHMRAYEKLEKQKRVPIIALSGLASEDTQKEAIGSGMDVLLTKPVQLKTLGNLLKSEGIIADD